jgi:prepilin-type N-terminal cleavage/methylation domain-containing protein
VRRGERSTDAGFSLVEVTVTVALLSIVMASVLGALAAFQRVGGAADHRLRNLEQARVMMAVLTKDLRTATSFTTASASEVVFLGNLNTCKASDPPVRVRLYTDTQGRLLEELTPTVSAPTSTACATELTAARTRVVGTSVTNGTAVFGFLNDAGVATTTLNQIASVSVQLSVQMPSTFARNPSTLSTSVWLPNVAAAKVTS